MDVKYIEVLNSRIKYLNRALDLACKDILLGETFSVFITDEQMAEHIEELKRLYQNDAIREIQAEKTKK